MKAANARSNSKVFTAREAWTTAADHYRRRAEKTATLLAESLSVTMKQARSFHAEHSGWIETYHEVAPGFVHKLHDHSDK